MSSKTPATSPELRGGRKDTGSLSRPWHEEKEGVVLCKPTFKLFTCYEVVIVIFFKEKLMCKCKCIMYNLRVSCHESPETCPTEIYIVLSPTPDNCLGPMYWSWYGWKMSVRYGPSDDAAIHLLQPLGNHIEQFVSKKI